VFLLFLLHELYFWQEKEEEEVEFTEEEEAIKANLESDEPLPAEVLDTIIPAWWNKEPFK
jgi:adenylate/nucleoside-diphosphate kinase